MLSSCFWWATVDLLFLLPFSAASPQLQNWYGDIVSHVQQEVLISSVADIIQVLQNPSQYPAPVRPAGSRHSMVPVEFPSTSAPALGTVLDMRPMNQILDITSTHVVAQAGALYIDVAEELDKNNLQFHINFEFGSITLGAAAVGSTKESSLPGQYGKLSSYVTAVKMVKVDGTLLNVNEDDDPELMQYIRSSYGLLGVIYEVTMMVLPRRAHSVEHTGVSASRFASMIPELVAKNEVSVFGYLDPFAHRVVLETKQSVDPPSDGSFNTQVWETRNSGWSSLSPTTCSFILRLPLLPNFIKYWMIDMFWLSTRVAMRFLDAPDTKPKDQILRYDDNPGDRRFRFTFQAYPLSSAATVIQDYIEFCKEYWWRTGYRTDMPAAIYVIPKADTRAHFSYSSDGPIFTIDAVTTGTAEGWFEFLQAYNEFASERGGIPTFGQTPMLSRSQVERAFGNERLDQFESIRKQFDPSGRLVNDYFRGLMPITI